MDDVMPMTLAGRMMLEETTKAMQRLGQAMSRTKDMMECVGLVDLTTPEARARMDGQVAGLMFAVREKCYDTGHHWAISGIGWPTRWERMCSQCLAIEPCAAPHGLLDRRIG